MYDKKGAANQGRGEGLAPVQLCLLPEFFHPTPSNSLPFAPLYFCVRARARARAFVSLEKVVILSRRKNPVYPAPFLPQSKLSASPHHPPPPSRSSSVPLRPLRSKVLTRFAFLPPPTPQRRTFPQLFVRFLILFHLIEYTLRIYFPRFREGLQGGWGM